MKEHVVLDSGSSKWEKHRCFNKTALGHKILCTFKQNKKGNDHVIARVIRGGYFTWVHTLTIVHSILKRLRIDRIATMQREAKKVVTKPNIDTVVAVIAEKCHLPNSASASSHTQNVAAADYNQRNGHEMTVCNMFVFFPEGAVLAFVQMAVS